MSTIALSANPQASWPADAPEARLLLELLRTSRVSLLFGEAGSDRTVLLTAVLAPLLAAQTSPLSAPESPRETGVVVQFPDGRRRAPAGASTHRRDVVVYFNDWAEEPLAALQATIHQSAGTGLDAPRTAPLRLAETLGALSHRLDADFIIVLDRFEQFLQAPAWREDTARFADELVQAVNDHELPANFLLSVSDEAIPRLASLRSRIPGFDDFSLKLARPKGATPATTPVQEPPPPAPAAIEAPLAMPSPPPTPIDASTPQPKVSAPDTGVAGLPAKPAPPRVPKVKRPPVPREQVTTGDVYALINATLARTTAGIPLDPAPDGEPFGPAWEDDDLAPGQKGQIQPPPPQTRRARLRAAVKRVWRRLLPWSGSDPGP